MGFVERVIGRTDGVYGEPRIRKGHCQSGSRKPAGRGSYQQRWIQRTLSLHVTPDRTRQKRHSAAGGQIENRTTFLDAICGPKRENVNERLPPLP
jgi:hypothetical protein